MTINNCSNAPIIPTFLSRCAMFNYNNKQFIIIRDMSRFIRVQGRVFGQWGKNFFTGRKRWGADFFQEKFDGASTFFEGKMRILYFLWVYLTGGQAHFFRKK